MKKGMQRIYDYAAFPFLIFFALRANRPVILLQALQRA